MHEAIVAFRMDNEGAGEKARVQVKGLDNVGFAGGESGGVVGEGGGGWGCEVLL